MTTYNFFIKFIVLSIFASAGILFTNYLNTDNSESAERMVSGTARSMGIKVE